MADFLLCIFSNLLYIKIIYLYLFNNKYIFTTGYIDVRNNPVVLTDRDQYSIEHINWMLTPLSYQYRLHKFSIFYLKAILVHIYCSYIKYLLLIIKMFEILEYKCLKSKCYLHDDHVFNLNSRRALQGTQELDQPCFTTSCFTHD